MDAESSKPKKRRWYQRIVPATVAGKATLVTAIFLAIALLLVWSLRLFGPQSVQLRHAMTVPRILAEIALTIAIPLCLNWGLRRWNQVIEGIYPDIDRAWQAGIDALEQQGIDLSQYPLFLVLGSSGTEVESGLMHAMDSKLRVESIPNTAGVSHALQWYLSEDAIYLFCPAASSLSALMSRWTSPSVATSVPRPVARPLSPVQSSSEVKTSPGSANSTDPVSGPTVSKESQKKPEPYLGTIQFGSVGPEKKTAPSPNRITPFAMPSKELAAAPVAAVATSQPKARAVTSSMRPAPTFQGTLFGNMPAVAPVKSAPELTSDVGETDEDDSVFIQRRATATDQADQPPSTSQSEASKTANPTCDSTNGSMKVALPASLDTSDELPRLEYVCKLLRRIRQPRCGINGTVTLIPFELSRVGPLQLSAISQAVRGDVNVIQETLGVRAPVTAVLVGLEQDKGFTELVRRLQPELLSRRLGGRFDLRSRPTPEELNVHSDRLCDAFEDWVYRLFGRDDALAQQRGNRKLYALISRIRHELKPRLRIVLGQAFGCQSTEKLSDIAGDQSFFFSGCYFAASSVQSGQGAFVKGVFRDKLLEEQSQVQWTAAAIRRHKYFKAFAVAGWIVVAAVAALLLRGLLAH